MSQQTATISGRRRFSLSFRVSLLLMLAATLPLIITVAISEPLARPALTAQANKQMDADVQTRVQLVDSYLTERLLDTETVTQVQDIQEFLGSPNPSPQFAQGIHVALTTASIRDSHYSTWSLFDARNKPVDSSTDKPKMHGKYIVPPSDIQQLMARKPFIAPVYFDPTAQKAFIDIYAPVLTYQTHDYLGFIRSTLDVDKIWDVVNKDTGVNGNGSYAFIVDQNGVRIADPVQSRRFTSIVKLDIQKQQAIIDEARYGKASPVPILADDGLQRVQTAAHPDATFQITPAGENQVYQMKRQNFQSASWTFFVASPLKSFTAVADQQLYIVLLVACVVLFLAALTGILVGRGVTGPIIASIENLRDNSQALINLASRQKNASTEQSWIIESSKVGVQSVQYYTHASVMAIEQLNEATQHLLENKYIIDARSAEYELERIIATARYAKHALHYQGASNEKLSVAIQVTTTVHEQLSSGAAAATSSAEQMEQVVERLREVVGR